MTTNLKVQKLLRRWPFAVYALTVVLASIALVAWVNDGSFSSKDLAAGLLALVGTFFGALFAFRLEESREKAREVQARKSAINRALFVLGYQHNEVGTYLRLMNDHPNDLDLAFRFEASQPPEQSALSQRLDDLDFLLASPDPNILFELLIEQVRFDQAMYTIRLRNAFMVNHVQPVFAKLVGAGKAVSSAYLEEVLGEYLFRGAMQGATSIRFHITECDKSIPAAAGKLRAIANEIFPGEKFVEFELITAEETSASP